MTDRLNRTIITFQRNVNPSEWIQYAFYEIVFATFSRPTDEYKKNMTIAYARYYHILTFCTAVFEILIAGFLIVLIDIDLPDRKE